MFAAFLVPLALAATTPAEERSIAVFPLQAKGGLAQGTVELLTDFVIKEVRDARVFDRVVGAAEVLALLGPARMRMVQECANDSCVLVDAELAGGFGTTHLLSGSVGMVDDMFIMSLRLLDLRSALEVASVAEHVTIKRESETFHVLGPAVKRLLAGMKPPAAPSSAAPESSPRIRPARVGAWVGAGVVGGTAMLGVGVAVLTSAVFAALRAWDIQRVQSGQGHGLPRTAALAANILFVGAALSPLVVVPLVMASAGLLGASWLL